MKTYHSKILLKALLVLVLMFCGCTNKKESFREDVAGKVGDHVYYSYNLYEGRNLDEAAKKDIFEYLEAVDQKLTEDMYITGWCYSSIDGRIMIYGRLCVNGVIVPEVTYMTDFDDPTPNVFDGRGKYRDEEGLSENIYVPDEVKFLKEFDTSNAVDPGDLIPTVTEKALQHKDELRDYDKKGICGDYLLCYDVNEQRLVYKFRVNEYSEIVLDAMTGELVKEDYWDGVIID